MTTSDVVVSDVVILATSEVPVSTVLTAAAGGLSTSGPRKQLKLKVDHSGIGLVNMKEPSTSEVRYQTLKLVVVRTPLNSIVQVNLSLVPRLSWGRGKESLIFNDYVCMCEP